MSAKSLGLIVGFVCLWIWVSPARGFFLTAIQGKGQGYARRGEQVTWYVFRTEPFQGLLYDLKLPKVEIYAPGEKPTPLSLLRIKLRDPATGKKRYAYKAHFVPKKEGDYFLVLSTEPTLVPESNEVWQEFVKVPLHLVREGAWDQILGLPIEIILLTRPYGLTLGVPFRGRILFQGRPLPGAKIQVIPFHGAFIPPQALPQDQWGQTDYALMYQASLTNEEGEFITGFAHEGWWLVTVAVSFGQYRLGPNSYPFFWRASLWLYVKGVYQPPENAPKLQFP